MQFIAQHKDCNSSYHVPKTDIKTRKYWHFYYFSMKTYVAGIHYKCLSFNIFLSWKNKKNMGYGITKFCYLSMDKQMVVNGQTPLVQPRFTCLKIAIFLISRRKHMLWALFSEYPQCMFSSRNKNKRTMMVLYRSPDQTDLHIYCWRFSQVHCSRISV